MPACSSESRTRNNNYIEHSVCFASFSPRIARSEVCFGGNNTRCAKKLGDSAVRPRWTRGALLAALLAWCILRCRYGYFPKKKTRPRDLAWDFAQNERRLPVAPPEAESFSSLAAPLAPNVAVSFSFRAPPPTATAPMTAQRHRRFPIEMYAAESDTRSE